MSDTLPHLSRRNLIQIATAGAAAYWLFPVPNSLAQNPPANPARAVGAPAPLEVVELEADLKVLMGAGGNISLYHDAGSAILVDCGLPDRAAQVLETVQKLVPSVSRRVLVNTHWHFDHVGGNTAFGEAGYTLVGSGLCRKRLGEKILLEDLGMTFEPTAEVGRPTITLDTAMTLIGPGGASVTLTKLPPSHTDTDISVRFEKYNIIQTGDTFFNGAFPVIDRSTGGSLDRMIEVTKLLLTQVDDSTRIIPGHGPMAKKADLKGQLDLLEKTRELLAPFAARKASLDEVLAAGPLASLDDKYGRGFLRSPTFTKMAYGQYLTK